jgi:hypothetical protein
MSAADGPGEFTKVPVPLLTAHVSPAGWLPTVME